MHFVTTRCMGGHDFYDLRDDALYGLTSHPENPYCLVMVATSETATAVSPTSTNQLLISRAIFSTSKAWCGISVSYSSRRHDRRSVIRFPGAIGPPYRS